MVNMTDLEITKLCAEAMGIDFISNLTIETCPTKSGEFCIEIGLQDLYDPLHDDAQAMALVRRLKITCEWINEPIGWTAHLSGDYANDSDLSLAIVKCVAKMQRARNEKLPQTLE